MESLLSSAKEWLVSKLLYKRSPLDLELNLENTELHWAVIYNNPVRLHRLINEDKIDRFQKNRMGLTAARLAQFLDHGECLHILDPSLKQAPILFQDKEMQEPEEVEAKEFGKRMGINYLSTLGFDSFETLLDVFVQCSRAKRDKWLEQEAIWLGSFHRVDIERQREAKFTIKWISDEIGYGCFANEDIPEGRYVGEYAGKVFRRSYFDWRSNDYCFKYPSSVYLRPKFSIDSADAGNFTRYFNHSDNPNLEAMGVLAGSFMHIVFRTWKPVKAGDQFTFDYGPYYWRWRFQKKIKI